MGDDFKKCISLNPNDFLKSSSFFCLGSSKAAIGDFYAAIEDMNNGIKYYDQSPLFFKVEFHIQRASYHVELKQFKKAEDDWIMTIFLDPNNPLPYKYLGWLNSMIYERYKEAIPFLDKAILLFNEVEDGRSYYYRGICEMKLSIDDKNYSLNRGCDFLQKAKSLGIIEAADPINRFCN